MMDLEAVRNVKATFDATADAEVKAEMHAQAEATVAFLAERFPAMVEADRAAVAWLLAEILNTVRDIPVNDAGKMLLDSAAAYALATVTLLGWDEQ